MDFLIVNFVLMKNSALINITQKRLMNIDWFLRNALEFFSKVKFFIPTIDMIWWMEKERRKINKNNIKVWDGKSGIRWHFPRVTFTPIWWQESRACIRTLRYILEDNLEARISDFLSSLCIHLRCAVAYARNAAADR